MSTLNPKTRRTVAAGLVVALGLMAPVGAAVADEISPAAGLLSLAVFHRKHRASCPAYEDGAVAASDGGV